MGLALLTKHLRELDESDTCCIDKSSSAELSEAINPMYQWYKSAVMCYVYLSTVEATDQLEDSVWFTRGWTLQGLIVRPS